MSESDLNINKKTAGKRVLLAPMDWGLGHATRCIPVIEALRDAGFEVILAGEKKVAALLQKEFPELVMLALPGYNVNYGKSRIFFFLNMLLQFPKINTAIRKENAWLQKTISEHKIDIVISDNRFGMYSEKAHCVFITHQLFIKTGNSFTEKIARRINYKYIDRFAACWVPDNVGNDNLAGELSHPEKMPEVRVKYIGPLSRFIKKQSAVAVDIVAVLSGPEPQRSIFENVLSEQMAPFGKKAVLVRGLPDEKAVPLSKNKVLNHLPAVELNELMSSSKMIIARSGYSTVMDLAALQKKAILVPTPGQTEQEYLATFLSEKKYCIAADQEGFDLADEIKKMNESSLNDFPSSEKKLLTAAVRSLL